MSKSDNLSALFELAILYRDRGDFRIAVDKLKEASLGYHEQRDFKSYLKCTNILLRLYAELTEYDKIDELKEQLQDLVINEEVSLDARSYYTLGLCACYKKQFKTSLEYLEKSLALALAEDDKEDICYAISGIAIIYYLLGRYEDALKEIYNLKVFFQVLPLSELKLATQILNGNILRRMQKPEQAIDIFWKCYDDIKHEKNFYMYVSLLHSMGRAYLEMGDEDMARMYLTLAKKTADPENLVHFSQEVDEVLDRLGGNEDSTYDIVFNSATKSIVEKKKGRVDFKNQFILLDMLRLFLDDPGEVYTKEQLVEQVWKQSYDPSVHDNKIYVTIKRLRKMIEPDYDKPRYIFRAKNGYYLNRNARVLMN